MTQAVNVNHGGVLPRGLEQHTGLMCLLPIPCLLPVSAYRCLSCSS